MNEQGLRYCTHCGKQLPTTAIFCPSCGEKISVEMIEPVPPSVGATLEDEPSPGNENGPLAKQSSDAVIIHDSLAMKFLVRLLWIDVGLAIAFMFVAFSVNAFSGILAVICLIWRILVAYGLERHSENSREWCVWLAIINLLWLVVGGVGTCLLADICNIVICICGVLCLTRSVREECKATLRGAK